MLASDQYAQQVIRAKTELLFRDANDAGTAGPNHFYFDAVAETQFFQALNMFGPSDNLGDGRLWHRPPVRGGAAIPSAMRG
jgi:hypothetical protein